MLRLSGYWEGSRLLIDSVVNFQVRVSNTRGWIDEGLFRTL